MNDKGSANLTVIGHPVALDEVLEADYAGNCLLGKPDFILVAWNPAFLGDLKGPSITSHDERIAGLGDLGREPFVSAKVKH